MISSRSNSVKISVDCLELSEDIVHASPSARNLGVIMGAHFSLENHVNQIRKTCFYFLCWIRKVRPYLTREAAKSLVQALVISKLDYCNSLLVNAPAKRIDKLQSVLKDAARIVRNIPKLDHITPTMMSLHWLPVPQHD